MRGPRQALSVEVAPVLEAPAQVDRLPHVSEREGHTLGLYRLYVGLAIDPLRFRSDE